MIRLLGVDGCPYGWVVAESRVDSADEQPRAAPVFWLAASFAELLEKLGQGPAIVAVDIPIGLPMGRPRDDGVRAADKAVRAFLGSPRSSSVFSAPCRRTLAANSYLDACAAEFQARRVQLSKQAFGILPKIKDVDGAITQAHQASLADADGPIVREVHPEAAFAMLVGDGQPGCGLPEGKRTAAGETRRLDLLAPYVGAVDIGAERSRLLTLPKTTTRIDTMHTRTGTRQRVVGRDDLVDALSCLVVAYRIVTGQVCVFPDGPPQCDERDLRMEILA